MKMPIPSRLFLVGLLLALPLAAGCKSVKDLYADTLLKGDVISYQAYLSMDQDAASPPTARDLIAALGTPAAVYDRNGRPRKVVYNAYSLNDDLKKAEFYFDTNEILVKKELW